MTTTSILRFIGRFIVVYLGLLHKVLENTSPTAKMRCCPTAQ